MSNKKNAVRKFTLDDLKPVQQVINVPHPVHGDVNATFTLLPPQSYEYIDAYTKRVTGSALADLPIKEKLEATASVPVSVMVGWNEELFGPFSKEAALSLLSDPTMHWILFYLSSILENGNTFYKDN